MLPPADATATAAALSDPLWTVRTALRTLAWWTITLAFTLTLMGRWRTSSIRSAS